MSKYFKSIKSYEDLKNQYKNLLKANHPDNGGDVETMKEINVEYDAGRTKKKPRQAKRSKRQPTAQEHSFIPCSVGREVTTIGTDR